MIWANFTKFGQNFIALQIFLAGAPMPIIDVCTGAPPDEVNALLPLLRRSDNFGPLREKVKRGSSIWDKNTVHHHCKI